MRKPIAMNAPQTTFVVFRIKGDDKYYGLFVKGHSLGGAEHVILDGLQTANYALAFPVNGMEMVFEMFPDLVPISEMEFQGMKA